MPHSAAGFSRHLRLLDGKQFATVFNRRKRIHGASFSVHTGPNALDHPRIGLAVSKKVSKKAVQRNRIKRVIRDSFRLYQHELGTVDYVVVAKPGADQRKNRELRSELEILWAKAR